MGFFVVEDDPAVGDALCELLATVGDDVALYRDAESFLAESQPTADDIVIIDIGLPGMSGADLVRHLEFESTSRPRMIAISGAARHELEALVSSLPFVRFLRKPPSMDWVPLILGS